MDVLWVSHFLLFPETGFGALQRSRNLLRSVAKYHKVTLLSLYRESDLPEGTTLEQAKNSLLEFCHQVELIENTKVNSSLQKGLLFVGAHLKGLPYSTEMYGSSELQQRVRWYVESGAVDLVHLDTMGLADEIVTSANVPAALNHHNVESHMMQRRAARASNPLKKYSLSREAHFLENYERRYCGRFSLNFAVSELDAQRMREIIPKTRVEVVENGVDCDFYQPRKQLPKSPTMIFVGSMDWYPNSDAMLYFYQSIFPRIREANSEAKLTLVGKSIPREVEQMSSLKGLSGSIHCTGFVADIRPVVSESRVFVCPIREGGGTRLKLLDAFAQGIPVVSTTIGAEGLDVVDREHLLIADTPEEFSKIVIELFEDDELCSTLASNARAYVERRFSFEVLGVKLSEFYQSVSGAEYVRDSRNI